MTLISDPRLTNLMGEPVTPARARQAKCGHGALWISPDYFSEWTSAHRRDPPPGGRCPPASFAVRLHKNVNLISITPLCLHVFVISRYRDQDVIRCYLPNDVQ